MIEYVSKYWITLSHFQSTGSMEIFLQPRGTCEFVSQIKLELSNSLNNAIMANNGNPNIKERPNSKSALAAKVKKTLMIKLEEGTVDILSYQQAVGRSIFKTNSPTTEIEMSNDHLVVFGDKDEEEIVVPDLKDVLVPLSIVPQTESAGLEQEETIQNPDVGCQVGRKRKSQMSYSVVVPLSCYLSVKAGQ